MTLFDTTALESLPPKREVEQYWAADNPDLWRKRLRNSLVVLVGLSLIVGFVLNTLTLVALQALHADSLLPTSLSRIAVFALLVLGVALVLAPIFGLLPYHRLDYQLIGLYQLRQFSRANGMQVKLEWGASPAAVKAAGSSVPGMPGSIFSAPNAHGVVVAPLVVPAKGAVTPVLDGRRLRVGHVQFYQFSERTRTQDWIFAELTLPQRLPHIWLHSRHHTDGSSSAVPYSLAPGDRVSLEGDFDRYFDTYAPEGVQQEALYVLTPDVMALLIDNAARFNVEIVDDRLYLYTRGYFDVLVDASWWQAVAAVVNSVGTKVTRSATHYRAAPSTAEAARRLHTRGVVWRRIVQAVGIVVLFGGPAVLFALAAHAQG